MMAYRIEAVGIPALRQLLPSVLMGLLVALRAPPPGRGSMHSPSIRLVIWPRNKERTHSLSPRAFGAQPTTESVSEGPSHSRRRRSSTGTDPSCPPRNETELHSPRASAMDRSAAVRPKSTKSHGTDISTPPKSSATNRSLGNQTQLTDRSLAWESIDWAQAARSYGTLNSRTVPLHSPSPTKIRQVTPLPPGPVESRRIVNELNVQSVFSSAPDGQEMPAVRKKKSRTQFNDADAFLAGGVKN